MPLKLWRRGDKGPWYIRGVAYRGGPGVYESTGLVDRRLAQLRLREREAELVRRGSTPATQWVTFQEALASFLEAHPPAKASERRRFLRLLDVFEGKLSSSIDQVAVDDACRRLLRPGSAGATRLREVITPLTSVLRHASRRGWCSAPEFERPKPAPGKTRWLTPAEAEALQAAAAPHLAPLIRFLVCTGARLSEALELDWQDVNLAAGRAVFRRTKTGQPRLVELPPAAIAALANLPHGRDGRVFLRPVNLRKAHPDAEPQQAWAPYRSTDREAGGQIKTAWHAAVRRAGIAACTPHDLRHSFATHFYIVHRDLLRLQHAGGWRSHAMVHRYTHLCIQDLRGEVLAYWGVSEVEEAARRA